MKGRFRPAGEPERKPNMGNAIRILSGKLYLDSPTQTHGVSVAARIDGDGWLAIEVGADDSVKGWTLAYNGQDFPTTDAALRAELDLARAQNLAEVGFGDDHA